jgi:hypothetical protein
MYWQVTGSRTYMTETLSEPDGHFVGKRRSTIDEAEHLLPSLVRRDATQFRTRAKNGLAFPFPCAAERCPIEARTNMLVFLPAISSWRLPLISIFRPALRPGDHHAHQTPVCLRHVRRGATSHHHMDTVSSSHAQCWNETVDCISAGRDLTLHSV